MPPESLSANGVRRFLLIYASGIVAMYATALLCGLLTPHSSDLEHVGLAIGQAVGAAACAWLVMALVRIVQNEAIRRNRWTWWLLVANLFMCTAVLPVV
jgi:O-antigen ligase